MDMTTGLLYFRPDEVKAHTDNTETDEMITDKSICGNP